MFIIENDYIYGQALSIFVKHILNALILPLRNLQRVRNLYFWTFYQNAGVVVPNLYIFKFAGFIQSVIIYTCDYKVTYIILLFYIPYCNIVACI